MLVVGRAIAPAVEVDLAERKEEKTSNKEEREGRSKVKGGSRAEFRFPPPQEKLSSRRGNLSSLSFFHILFFSKFGSERQTENIFCLLPLPTFPSSLRPQEVLPLPFLFQRFGNFFPSKDLSLFLPFECLSFISLQPIQEGLNCLQQSA